MEVKEGGVLRQRAGHTGRLKELFIHQVKIGLQLRLSLRCCWFVCIDKSCDLANRTLCISQQPEKRWREGWREEGREECEEEEEQQHSAAKSTSSSGKPFSCLCKRH